MLPHNRTSLRALLLALGLAAMPVLPLSPLTATSAWAQDDDDDDGDDDDDDDDGGPSFGGGGDDDDGDNDNDDNAPRGILFPGRVPPPPAPAPLLDQATDQVVVDGLDATSERQLLAEGFTIVARNSGLLLLEVPDGLDVATALETVQAIASEALAAPNSYYRSQAVPVGCEGALCDHWQAVDWPPSMGETACTFEPHIGVIDTGVNIEHAMLSQARLTLETIGSPGAEPSQHKHGTAIVAMFVGDQDDRVPGLAPAAQLLVVDPFGRVGNDERSDVFALVAALDRLDEADVDVASLSLAGPDNPLLAAAIERLQASGIPVVAAVGNAGPHAEPLYPAAYADVVAVTAVDGRANIYRRAVQGEHVSFAAPGVEIATAASISGVRPQTGTSFAVPFVTTALAAAMAGDMPAETAIALLAERSRDLGELGRDRVFGWGLIQMPSPC